MTTTQILKLLKKYLKTEKITANEDAIDVYESFVRDNKLTLSTFDENHLCVYRPVPKSPCACGRGMMVVGRRQYDRGCEMDADKQHYANYIRATIRTMDDPNTMTNEQIYAAWPWVGAMAGPHLDCSRRWNYAEMRRTLLALQSEGY